MTTAIALANVQLPAYLADLDDGLPSVMDDARAGAFSSDIFPRLSIKAGRFRIQEGGDETVLNSLQLAAVVVGVNRGTRKSYYTSGYNQDEAAAPLCFTEDGVRPDPAASAPQCDNCATWPHNVKGSKINEQGKEVKACPDYKRIAVVSADDLDGTVYEMTMSVTSRINFDQYIKDLGRHGIRFLEAVTTVIGFDSTVSYPKLTFSFGGMLSQEEAMKARAISRSDLVKDVVRQKDTAPAPAAALPAPKMIPVAAPKAVAQVAAPVEAPAPAPKKGFGAAAAAPAAAPKTAPKPAPKPAAKPAPVAAAPAPTAPLSADLSDFEAELAEFAESGAADDAE